MSQNNEQLVKKAFIAMENAYAPYSNYHVGAALRLKNGVEIIGANIENASFGATCCAERKCHLPDLFTGLS